MQEGAKSAADTQIQPDLFPTGYTRRGINAGAGDFCVNDQKHVSIKRSEGFTYDSYHNLQRIFEKAISKICPR